MTTYNVNTAVVWQETASPNKEVEISQKNPRTVGHNSKMLVARFTFSWLVSHILYGEMTKFTEKNDLKKNSVVEKMTEKYEILQYLCEAFDIFSESERKLNLFKYLKTDINNFYLIHTVQLYTSWNQFPRFL